ncbi:unnamed protein product [Spirodela intermedia]|uniref:Uncharacterized protein n=1 Tax=Spirodela intermedia TaxID=51605 RepID=A0A7I8JDK8_SPIIN|nr:unnamed protein product [Spirodela intermedia]CAA6668248.1 unnamed protein product [Spirodela intermedia]
MGLSLLETLASKPPWVLLCSSVGTFTVLRFSFFLLRWFYTYSLRPTKNLLEYGRWAVRGLNLVLVDHVLEKLIQVATEIKTELETVDLRTAVVDLAGDLTEEIGRLESVSRDIDVGILVNKAGVINVNPLYLHEMNEAIPRSILKMNLVGMTKVLRAVLPGMLRRGRGTIINVSSGTAVVVPSFLLFSVYAATKAISFPPCSTYAYIRNISRCLHHEYYHTELHIPLVVATKMVPLKKISFFTPQPKDYTHSAIRSIGYGFPMSSLSKESLRGRGHYTTILPNAQDSGASPTHRGTYFPAFNLISVSFMRIVNTYSPSWPAFKNQCIPSTGKALNPNTDKGLIFVHIYCDLNYE